ncbi:MAG: haloacid dehalogenase-like hydrolase [Steroidobacteraceae bacterium]
MAGVRSRDGNPAVRIDHIDHAPWVEPIIEDHPRLAAFDCDGTLWSVDSGIGFFKWELERGVVGPAAAATARSQYADYLSGSVSEDAMSGYLATMHHGLSIDTVRAAAEEYVTTNVRPTFFYDMIRLVDQLRDIACNVWLVSSTNQWVIEAGAALIGLSADRVLATAAAIVDGLVTDQLERVPNGLGKRIALQSAVGAAPDAAFGNSRWDVEMLTYARQAYAVHPTAELARIASECGWPVLYPQLHGAAMRA